MRYVRRELELNRLVGGWFTPTAEGLDPSGLHEWCRLVCAAVGIDKMGKGAAAWHFSGSTFSFVLVLSVVGPRVSVERKRAKTVKSAADPYGSHQ